MDSFANVWRPRLRMALAIVLIATIILFQLPGRHGIRLPGNSTDNVTVELVPDGNRLFMVISGPADREVALRTGWENIDGEMTRPDGTALESPYADKMALSGPTSWTTAGNGKQIVMECRLANRFATGTGTYRFHVTAVPPEFDPDAERLFKAKSIWKGPLAVSNTITVTSVAGIQRYQ